MKLTKKQAGMVKQYKSARATVLSDVYSSCSSDKARVYDYLVDEMLRNGGHDVRIPSANCHHFTLAYRYRNSEGEWRLRYHTYANAYDMPWPG